MKAIYAIRLKDGNWAKKNYWDSTPDLEKAGIYGQLRYAKAALTRNKNLRGWENAELVTIEVYAGDDEIEHIKKFYAAESLPDLVKGLVHHIEGLQFELQKYKPKMNTLEFVRA
jgi:nicotinic acid mononucleotide adenylyltransferase